MTNKRATYRKRMRQAFEAAKDYLAHSDDDLTTCSRYSEEFICNAIEMAAADGRITEAQHAAAKDIVMDRIRPFYDAEVWLWHRVGRENVIMAGCTAVQQWRHRWLDSMIQEFSK